LACQEFNAPTGWTQCGPFQQR